MSTIPAPPRMSSNPVGRLVGDVLAERRARGTFPPGPRNFSLKRTLTMAHDPLALLLPLYAEHGPIFSMRILHGRPVFMLGPAANRFVTVEHPEYFHWRESSFGDLIPLLGDGLLTTDGAYHDRARRIMMPSFHREQIAASVAVMGEEAERALEPWRAGETVDVYEWTRNLAMRIAMRALLGLDPDDGGRGAAAAEHFERALGFYGIDYALRLLRGPGSPWRRMHRTRAILDEILFAEIRKRRAGGGGSAGDLLDMLLASRDEDGSDLSGQEVRDQAMTLLFAGHDTTTSTVSFMLYELARAPEWADRIAAGDDEALEMVLDETLRLYPPAWIGPRRAVRDFEFAGHRVKRGTYVNYCSWASHRLPGVFSDPESFQPERFERERKTQLERGAYVPFGAGSRICIGKRFGQLEVKALASAVVTRFRLEPVPGYELRIRQMPTLSPVGGLPMILSER